MAITICILILLVTLLFGQLYVLSEIISNYKELENNYKDFIEIKDKIIQNRQKMIELLKKETPNKS